MRVVVATELRFFGHGRRVYAAGSGGYDFWARYLGVFNEVCVMGRVASKDKVEQNWKEADGHGVSFVPIPHYVGPLQLALRYLAVRRAVSEHLSPLDAVILRAPGTIASILHKQSLGLSRPYGIEVVGDPETVFQSGVVDHPLRHLFRWWFARSLRRQIRSALAVAYVTERMLQAKYPVANDVPVFSYSSVELTDKDFRESPRLYSSSDGIENILTIGSLEQPYKGIDVLIDAMSICRERGVCLDLRILGEGRFRAALEDRAKERRLSGRVHFLGMIPSGEPVRNELDRADLFVLPSKTEGLPRALIEAMARGMPCIGSRVGGIPELLPEEDLVERNDPQGLAERIVEIVSNPQRMSMTSSRNLKRARDYHHRILTARRSAFYQLLRTCTESWIGKRMSA